MAATTISVTFKIEPELKKEAEMLFDELGLTMSGAIHVFLRQAVREGGLPFQVTKNLTQNQENK